MSDLSNYLENKINDAILRGQAFPSIPNVYVALFTTAPDDAGGGTEVTGGSYARVTVAATLANWSGTQGAGTTAVSSGTSGITTNNIAITFPAPTVNWGICSDFAIYDSLTGGNQLFKGALGSPKTVNAGDAAPSFPAGTLSFASA